MWRAKLELLKERENNFFTLGYGKILKTKELTQGKINKIEFGSKILLKKVETNKGSK